MKVSRFLPLIGIILFLYIIWNMDLVKIFEFLKNINLLYLILPILIIAPMMILNGLKWKVLIKSYDIDYPLLKSISARLVGFSIGIITPGRLGDLSRAYYLKEKTSLGKALTTVVVDRIIDILILLCLAIMGIFAFMMSYTYYTTMYIFIGVFFVLFLILLFLISKKGFTCLVLKPFFKRLIPERYKSKISEIFHEFYDGLEIMRRRKPLILISAAVCIAVWFIAIFQYYLLALALNIPLSYQFLIIVTPITLLLDSLPISFLGLGTRDAAMIFFFSFISLPAELAISFSLLLLFINYFITGFAGLLIWFKNPIKF